MSPILLATLSLFAPPEPSAGAGTNAAPEAGGPGETAEVGVVAETEKDPTRFPDPKKFARGFFMEGAAGTVVPVGATSNVLSPGFALSIRTGFEIRRWIAIQLHGTGTSSYFDDGVFSHELLHEHFGTGELRLAIPAWRFLFAFQGGGGVFYVSTNALQTQDILPNAQRVGFAWDGSFAIDFHSLNRHFSGGALTTIFGMPAQQNSMAATAQLYIRYTY
jgi:hypothetical protein